MNHLLIAILIINAVAWIVTGLFCLILAWAVWQADKNDGIHETAGENVRFWTPINRLLLLLVVIALALGGLEIWLAHWLWEGHLAQEMAHVAMRFE